MVSLLRFVNRLWGRRSVLAPLCALCVHTVPSPYYEGGYPLRPSGVAASRHTRQSVSAQTRVSFHATVASYRARVFVGTLMQATQLGTCVFRLTSLLASLKMQPEVLSPIQIPVHDIHFFLKRRGDRIHDEPTRQPRSAGLCDLPVALQSGVETNNTNLYS